VKVVLCERSEIYFCNFLHLRFKDFRLGRHFLMAEISSCFDQTEMRHSFSAQLIKANHCLFSIRKYAFLLDYNNIFSSNFLNLISRLDPALRAN